jgi:hypothetical protein
LTYFADLTPYTYDVTGVERLNVGWLDAEHGYPTGPADGELGVALVYLLRFQVNPTRGAHGCFLCGRRMIELVDDHGDEWLLGAAEIHVDGDDGSAAAPSLIVHYVREHGYRSPRPFRGSGTPVRTLPRVPASSAGQVTGRSELRGYHRPCGGQRAASRSVQLIGLVSLPGTRPSPRP